MNLEVNDISNQKLLYFMKELFGNLQNSWQRSYVPKSFTANILDFEGNPIDINVQMDVEEFFNLLWDRVESQIQSTEEKQRFRTFYNGDWVQQVKSKECEHISERDEPFSAIHCDIKGRKNLQDSLRAYIEGEVLDGGKLIPYTYTSSNLTNETNR
jgi:ubiquitin carboxyl-terminal hydrolase 34